MQSIVIYAMVCICSYLQSILRYQFLTLDAYHLDTPYVRAVGICGYLLKPKGVCEQSSLGNTVLKVLILMSLIAEAQIFTINS
jgi:hypothetical protein